MPLPRFPIQLVTVLCVALESAHGQDARADHGSAQLVIGAGLPSGDSRRLTPAYLAGFQFTPPGWRVTFRVAAEHWQDESGSDFEVDSWDRQRTDGVQLVGIRTFGGRRVQSYVLAGVGAYSRRNEGTGRRYAWTDSGFVTEGYTSWSVRETLPTPLLGVGATVRLGGSRVFGELRLPFYQHNYLAWGPNAPLVFGLRF